jgi:hypothetical protein
MPDLAIVVLAHVIVYAGIWQLGCWIGWFLHWAWEQLRETWYDLEEK